MSPDKDGLIGGGSGLLEPTRKKLIGVDGPGPERSSGALSSLLVADFSHVLAGPLCTQILGDLGADVIKVERKQGDDTRQWGPPFYEGTAAYYFTANRNKRSITLDLDDTQDRKRAVALASRADVLVENFRPGTMEKFGLGYDELAAQNESLVYCSINGYGRHAGARMPAYDFLIQASSGLMSITGNPDAMPVKVGVAVIDQFAGLYALAGIMAALMQRNIDGKGQYVEVALLQAGVAMLANQAMNFLLGGVIPQRLGDRHPNAAPYQLFSTCDRPIAVAAVNDRFFRLLCKALDRTELVEDSRFETNENRIDNYVALEVELRAVFLGGSAEHWLNRLSEEGVPCAPVNDILAAFAELDQLGLGMVETVPTQNGHIRLLKNPVHLSRTPVTTRFSPPSLGMNQNELLPVLDEWSKDLDADSRGVR